MSRNEVLEVLKKYCILLNSSGIPLEKAFLYGSYSREDATDKSDIDIMIVSSVFDTNNDILKAKAWRLTEQI